MMSRKAQYEAQFKQWKWNKNWKKNDWKYVARKFEERHNAGKESVVFRNGTMIPRAKVKKEISRHVHPNDRFSRRGLSLICAGMMSLIVKKRPPHQVRNM